MRGICVSSFALSTLSVSGGEVLRAVGAWQGSWDRAVEAADKDAVCRSFPFENVLDYYQHCGKQFVESDVLQELKGLQQQLAASSGARPGWAAGQAYLKIEIFLTMLLDKHDETFCYDTYIGTRFLHEWSLPEGLDFNKHQSVRVTHLIVMLCEVIRFEVQTLIEQETRWPHHLTDSYTRKQRVYYAIWAISMFSRYLSSSVPPIVIEQMLEIWKREAMTDLPVRPEIGNMALRVIDLVLSDIPPQTQQIFQMIAMPVTTSHDEYLFMRVLQSFEMMFSIMVKGLGATFDGMQDGEFEEAARIVQSMTRTMKSSLSLFRLLNTMPKENFDSFRFYHDGASAIQSKMYKRMEVLAAHPLRERLASAAFGAVPAVRTEYEAMPLNIEDLLREYLADDDVRADASFQRLTEALLQFDKTYVIWKNVHFKIAFRMIGEVRGTGNTPGTPFLRLYLNARLFPFLEEEAA
jgi:tryptophan 2,3-dioxygenase